MKSSKKKKKKSKIQSANIWWTWEIKLSNIVINFLLHLPINERTPMKLHIICSCKFCSFFITLIITYQWYQDNENTKGAQDWDSV